MLIFFIVFISAVSRLLSALNLLDEYLIEDQRNTLFKKKHNIVFILVKKNLTRKRKLNPVGEFALQFYEVYFMMFLTAVLAELTLKWSVSNPEILIFYSYFLAEMSWNDILTLILLKSSVR